MANIKIEGFTLRREVREAIDCIAAIRKWSTVVVIDSLLILSSAYYHFELETDLQEFEHSSSSTEFPSSHSSSFEILLSPQTLIQVSSERVKFSKQEVHIPLCCKGFKELH